ncbi:MAG: hypothetical protein K2O01_05570, partial [Bacteroidales bacterium]|nr:hypothetical protein [Bacteroidales bacterium]
MKLIRHLGKLAAFRFLCVVVLGGGMMAVRAQQTVELGTVAKDVSLDNLPVVRVVVPDIKMCPGQEYDLPVYLESDADIEVVSLQLLFEFPNYMVVEPVYEGAAGGNFVSAVITQRAPGTGSLMGAYHLKKHEEFPAHSLTLTMASGSYKPVADEPIMSVRVRCKMKGEAVVTLDTSRQHYTNIWISVDVEKDNQIVQAEPPVKSILFDTAHVMPAPDPVVWAMPDTVMCVNEAIRFWAEGGIRYEWEDISYVERPWIAEPMAEKREQYPLFCPKEPGYYTYRCKVTDRTGCSAYDTVQCMVRNNTLNLDFIKDTMVDMNTPAVLDAEFWGSPEAAYALSWEPASLVETPVMSGLTAASDKTHVRVRNRSLPLDNAQWFKVRLEDGYCKLELEQNVNVLGAPIGAVVTMNPSLFCVDT